MKFKEKLRTAIAEKLKPEELLKRLCPFEFEIKLKIFADAIEKKSRKKHDYAILLQVMGDEPFIEDPRDLEGFIAQITEGRETNIDVSAMEVTYKGELYHCIYIDFKKEEETT